MGLSLACVYTLLLLTIAYCMARLLTVEAKVILLVLVPSRTRLGYIKDYKIAGIRRGGVLEILGVIG